MPKSDSAVLMPILSPGKHRKLNDGACFMEFASWLAGESWSDHPACTHPALASLARLVNDCSTKAGRERLVALIPSVIGLVNDDPLTSLLVATRAASVAIAVASENRQQALATGLLCFERHLFERHLFERHLHGSDSDAASRISTLITEALDDVPSARSWAAEFSAGQPAPRPRDIARVYEAMLRVSVIGIAEACVSDPDALLLGLLRSAIADLTPAMGQQGAPLRSVLESRQRVLQNA